jgi:transcriptional regulator with XRE-family HTH domain
MTPDQIRKARISLKLTQQQMADMLDTDRQSITRMEMQPDAATHRGMPARAERLIKAYISGYRPEDWPK